MANDFRYVANTVQKRVSDIARHYVDQVGDDGFSTTRRVCTAVSRHLADEIAAALQAAGDAPMTPEQKHHYLLGCGWVTFKSHGATFYEIGTGTGRQIFGTPDQALSYQRKLEPAIAGE